jgi:pimeloyl-ACP methyl ester carboxylesterase
VAPGWVKTLNDAGYRVIAFDNRGHGASAKSHVSGDYTPQKMAADAAALLDHLGIGRAHVMGYSMGARIAAFLALHEPAKVATLVFGGLGSGMVDGVGDWGPIASALLAEDPQSIPHPQGRTFRAFADQTKSDRLALARMMPDAASFAIEGRDHMLSVGDRTFKARVLEFLRQHPL